MVTKARLKLIKSLSRKKNRKEHKLFVVEGYKSILELLIAGIYCEEILITDGVHELDKIDNEVTLISKADMKAISNVTSPSGYLAVFRTFDSYPLPLSGSIIALDNLQDPGNLGTIIRTADWFGITDIVCSEQTVDVYNPKCIQASMGSIARVQVHYTDLTNFLEQLELPVYPTAMEGESIYSKKLEQNAVILMGSESHGLSQQLLKSAQAITIPHYNENSATESLNVAIATSIIVSEWKKTVIEK